MQLNTDKKGLAALFKEWQMPLVEEIFHRKLTSREAHGVLEGLDVKSSKNGPKSVSRASIIKFLNNLVDLGLLDYEEETAKGGYRRIYKMTLTREEFAHKIMSMFFDKLIEAFPKESPTFPKLRP